MAVQRLITVEEHLTLGDIAAEARALAAEPAPPADPEFGRFIKNYMDAAVGAGDLAGERLAHMDAVGIDVQVVSHGNGSPSGLDHPRAVDLCHRVNHRVAAMVAENPSRFAAFATVPLVDPDAAADELRRCVHDLGFKGMLTAGTFHGQFLDHPRFRPLLRAAAELDVPLYIHPAPVVPAVQNAYYTGDWSRTASFMMGTAGFGWHVEAGVHVLRLIVAGVLDELPGLKILSGHWGETLPGYLERMDDQLGMAFPDRDRTIGQTYRDQVWVTPSGIYTDAQLQMCLTQMGPDHIIWSEDYPYIQNVEPRAFLDAADLTDEVREKIAHGNAERLLHL